MILLVLRGVTVGGIVASQLRGLGFDPDLGLQSWWSFTFSLVNTFPLGTQAPSPNFKLINTRSVLVDDWLR